MLNASFRTANRIASVVRYKRLILLLAACLCAIASWGQVTVPSVGNISNTRPGARPNLNGDEQFPASASDSTAARSDTASNEDMINGIEYHVDIPDSVLQAAIFMFHREPVQVKIMSLEHPALTPTGAQFCDALDAFNGNYYLTVTELGHPHISLAPAFGKAPGLSYKPNIFPGFYKTPENIYFYQVQKPYSVLAYHSSLKKDYQLHVTHTQNINDHWNFALDYHLFSPTGTFANSSATDHLVDINTNYYSPDARYQLSAGLITQKIVLGENNGLSNMDIFIDKRISNMAGIPVNETRRMSLTNDLTVFVRQSFNTVRQFKWYRPIKQQFIDTVTLSDTLRIMVFDTAANDSVAKDSITFRTSCELRDTIIGYDTILPRKPHCYNTGVFALDLQWDKKKYRYTDSTLYNLVSATLYWTNDAYMDHRWRNPLKIFGGIRPQIESLSLDESIYASSKLTNVALYPFGRIELSPFPAAELIAFAETAPNLSEYNLDACLLFPFRDSVGNSRQTLSLRAVVKASRPELIYTAQTLRHDGIAARGFNSVNVQKLELQYRRGSLLETYLSAQHIDNNIWFEERIIDGVALLTPCQSADNALLLQGRLNLYLKLAHWLHYDMQQIVQYSSNDNVVRVPLFASKNSFYSDFSLFNGALHTQVGIDLRYHTRYKADAYDPFLGTFYRQDEEEVGNYIWADFFINLQIKRASIYAKAGHLNSFIEQQGHCLLPGYPSKQFGFYFGITWKFFD